MSMRRQRIKRRFVSGGLGARLTAWTSPWRRAWRFGVILRRTLRTPLGRNRFRALVLARAPRAVAAVAGLYRRTWARRVRLVVVVGSFGKTTTARMVSVALGLADPGHAGANAGIALADGLLKMRRRRRHAVQEVAIADRGQMEEFARRLRPDIVVVTCVGSEHLSSLGTLETTRSEKAKMVSAVSPRGLVVLNGDDPHVAWMRTVARASVITCGFGEANDIQAYDVDDSAPSGTRFRVRWRGQVLDVQSRLLGRHMVFPCLAALAVALTEGIDPTRVLAALRELPPTYNRLQLIQLDGGAQLLMDAYKSAWETVQAALDALSRVTARRRLVVIGDVEEPPGPQGPIYKALGLRLAQVADRVLFIGGKKNFDRLKSGCLAGGLTREALADLRTDPHRIAAYLADELEPGDLVLIKGRSTQHLERVALLLCHRQVVCSDPFCRRRYDCASCGRRELSAV